MIRRAQALLRMRTIQRDRARAAVARARAAEARAQEAADAAASRARDLGRDVPVGADELELARGTLTRAEARIDQAQAQVARGVAELGQHQSHVRRSEKIVDRLHESARAAARRAEHREQDDRPWAPEEEEPA